MYKRASGRSPTAREELSNGDVGDLPVSFNMPHKQHKKKQTKKAINAKEEYHATILTCLFNTFSVDEGVCGKKIHEEAGSRNTWVYFIFLDLFDFSKLEKD